MKYCDKCKVKIIDNNNICPLCQHTLTDDGIALKPIFPYIPITYSKKVVFTKLIILFTVIVAVVSVVIDFTVPTNTFWSRYVIGAVVSIWLLLANGISKLRNIPKMILHQTMLGAVLILLWDYFTGMNNWSFNYALPFLFCGGNIALVVLYYSLHLRIDTITFYFFSNILLGFIPLWFILSGKLTILYPSLASISISIILLVTLILFYWTYIKEMLESKFHL